MTNKFLFDDEIENLYYEEDLLESTEICLNDNLIEIQEETTIEELTQEEEPPEEKKIEEIKNKNYWSDETEKNIEKYILNNYLHYTYKLVKYIKEIKQLKDNINIDYIIFLAKKIEFLRKEEIIKTNNEFFIQKIYPVLYTLARNILYTYNLFQKTIPVEEQVKECINYVYQKIILFDPSLNKKSFSYLGTIAKRFYIKSLEDEYLNYIVSTKINNIDDTTQKNISAKEKKLIKQKNEYDDKYYIEINDEQNVEIYNYDLLQKEITEKLINHIIVSLEEYIKNCDSQTTKKIIEQIIFMLSQNNLSNINFKRKEIIKILSKQTNIPVNVVKQEIKKIKEIYQKIKEDFNNSV